MILILILKRFKISFLFDEVSSAHYSSHSNITGSYDICTQIFNDTPIMLATKRMYNDIVEILESHGAVQPPKRSCHIF